MKRRIVLVSAIVIVSLFTPWASVNVYADIFFDDFNDGDADGWWLGHNQFGQYGNWRIENGSLLQNRPGDGYVALVEDLLFSSQTIETQLKMNSVAGYGGITLWHKDYNNWIRVRVYPAAGNIYVTENIDGSRPDRFLYPYQTSHNTWYNLRVDVDSPSGELGVYIDDNYLFTYTAITPYRTGSSGVFSGNSGGYFDDFSIVPVPSAVLLATLGLTFSGGLLRRRRGGHY